MSLGQGCRNLPRWDGHRDAHDPPSLTRLSKCCGCWLVARSAIKREQHHLDLIRPDGNAVQGSDPVAVAGRNLLLKLSWKR